MADREPIGGGGRPSGEMPFPNQVTPHAEHDLVLIAAATDRDADPSLRGAADRQMASCPECARLGGDLRLLSAGLTELPPSRPAPRDMRLTVEQAARLGRGRLWRRLLRPFGEAGLPGLRPIAGALTTLGLAGILVGAFPLGLGAGGAFVGSDAAAAPTGAQYGSEAAPVAGAPSAAPAAMSSDVKGLTPSSAGPTAGPARASAGSAGAGNALDNASDHAGPTRTIANDVAGPRVSPLTWVSLGLVVSGIGLFLIVALARRVA